MTMDQHRGSAARSVAAATIIALMLAVSAAHSQSAPAKANDGDIDAFIADLERANAASAAKAQAQAPAETRPAQPGDLDSFPVNTDPSRGAVLATPPPSDIAPAVREEAKPLLSLSDDTSPFRTLLLMIGGIAICALATIGLTLAFFALRKDMQRKKRGRRRRFGSFDSQGTAQAPHR